MRMMARLGLLLLVAGALACCRPSSDPGLPYLAFSWTHNPDYFYTDAPGVPALVGNGVDYETRAGSWTAEYYHIGFNDPGYFIDFTITRHRNGDDSLFDVHLYRDGPPTFDQLLSLTGNAAQVPKDLAPVNARQGFERKMLGTFDEVRGGYRFQGIYGISAPKS